MSAPVVTIPQIQSIVDTNAEAFEVLVDVLGVRDQLKAKIAERQLVQEEKNYAADLAALAESATQGKCKEGPAGEGALVLGRHSQTNRPISLPFDNIVEDQRKLVEGKQAGDTIDLPTGGQMKVEKVYLPVPAPLSTVADLAKARQAQAAQGPRMGKKGKRR